MNACTLSAALYEDPRRTMYGTGILPSTEHRQKVVRAFGRLVVPILDRHGVAPEHAVRRSAHACSDGSSEVGATILAALSAGVTPLEIKAIIELALREAYPTT